MKCGQLFVAMASLWNTLRSEVMGTVDEFRQKGAIGALRDAALDTRDMATDAGSWLWGNVKSLVGEDGEDVAVLCFEGVPPRGARAPLQFSDGRVVEAVVMEVDGVSDPPRAQVKVDGIDQPLLVLVQSASEVVSPEADPGFFANIKQEWNSTVQDFREKGAVGALKDATFDAVDLVGSTAGKAVDLIGNTAGKAVDGARSLIDLDTPEEPAPGTPAAPAAPAAPAGETQGGARGSVMQLVDGLRNEIKETVQDFREKGAVATFKDAALDAVDLVGSTATTAVNGAKTVAAPILEDFWAPKPEESATSPAGAAATSPAPAAVPSTASAPAASAAPAASSASSGVLSPSKESQPAVQPAPASPSPQAGGYVATTSPKTPEAEGDDAKQAKKSLVSMRRSMFEQKKEEPKDESKKETETQEEEVID